MSGVALTLGPLVIPYVLVLVALVALVSMAVGRWAARGTDADVEPALWLVLLVGLLAARLAFVWEFRSAYLESPLGIVDIRDGGWNPVAGLVGAWLVALHRAVNRPPMKRPLAWAMWTGTAVWFAGLLALAALPGPRASLPALTLDRLDGSPVALDSFEGRPTVVNLWATWCPPCRREMPMLHQAQRDHPGVHFVFLNQGETPAQVGEWLARESLPLRNVVLDPHRKAGAAFGQNAYPTTLFFNARGELVGSRVGELSRATLTEKLASTN